MSKIGNYVVGLQEAAAAKVDCPECTGEGTCTYDRYVSQGFSNAYGYYEDYITECDNCAGSGKVEEEDTE
jgi:DnaJ-class molecular chaperone|tara:strand:- start:518 stop:727 length:210 start_codon:yes stop_codon:yes gene_type:complete